MLAPLCRPSAHAADGWTDLRESSKYWQLRASNYLHASMYGEALACTDLAIRVCSKQSLGLLGRYYYLRGKILQASPDLSALLSFPLPCTHP